MPRALEQIRRMRGGAQSHLMRCDDGFYYVVKFQNSSQHRRVLVYELLGTRLAGRLGLPIVRAEIVEVSEELIRLTPELAVELPRARIPCHPGPQFGSRYPVDPHVVALHDFLPEEQLRQVENLHDFAGMLVFDKWTCNTNGRQAVFYYEGPGSPGRPEWRYEARMIDQGFCFNVGEWNFPDAPLRGLYYRNSVYRGVIGMESFAPWLERLEKQVNERVWSQLIDEIPSQWYEDDRDALNRLAEELQRRRVRVPDLILEAKRSSRQPFPNWI